MNSIDLTNLFGDSTLSEYFKPWVLQVFIIVLTVLLINFAFKIFLGKLDARAEKTANPWDDAFIAAVWRPFRLLVWIVAFCLLQRLWPAALKLKFSKQLCRFEM